MTANLLNIWEFHSAALVELVKDILVTALIIAAGIAASKAARRLIDKAVLRHLRIDDTVSAVMRHVVRYSIIIICIVMILNIFGVNTASLIALLGAAGVAIGLALKDTLGNIAAGIALLFVGTYRRGEYIEFSDYSGTVKDINLFTTILETPDGIYISAPNSSIWGCPLKNYTRNGKRRMELSIGISYSDSVETAFQVMRGVIAAEPRFLNDPAPQVILQSIQEHSVVVAVRAWTNIQDYWDIYWQQMQNLKAKMEEAGLHIPLPRQDVRILPQMDGTAQSAKIIPF